MKSVEICEFSEKMSLKEQCILHMHWPDKIFRHRYLTKVLIRYYRLCRRISETKLNGGKIIWTVHNLEPRALGSFGLRKYLWTRLILKFDGLIFLSNISKCLFYKRYSKLKDIQSKVIPHGHYKDFYVCSQDASTKADDRDSNYINLLIFGKLVPHKGIEKFLSEFSRLDNDAVRIKLAGKPSEQKFADALTALAMRDSRIAIDFRHIPDDEICAIFSECTATFLPYEISLNSGTAILSLSMNKPVIAPEIGSLTELRQMVGGEWMFLYEPPLRKTHIEKSLSWLEERKKSAISPDLSIMDWETISKATEAFYKVLLESK